jgi:hypothetical protein
MIRKFFVGDRGSIVEGVASTELGMLGDRALALGQTSKPLGKEDI